MVRPTSDDALSEAEFRELLKGAEDLGQPTRLEAKFVILVAGRLGLRAGEISHMKRHWINFDRQLIQIPYYESCNCGYCYQQAKQEVEHNKELTIEEAMNNRWHAKTEYASRAVPYSFSNELREIIIEFFKKYGEFPTSRLSVNRRVRQAKDESSLGKRVYPHALRATAATYHAYKGLPAIALQNLMGWSKLRTAQKYLRKSAGATAKALEEIHG